jgi:hypothetical protein
MIKYTQEELNKILELHKKWLNDETDGVKADLSYSDLSYSDLSYSDLRHADLSSSDLRYANLHSANLSSADLSSVNLHSADLSSADLSYADLSSADLSSVIGEMNYIKSLQCEKYNIVYTHNMLYIGCKSYLIEEWKNFTDEEISKMDKGALEWWKVWKPIIMNIIEISPAKKD